MLLLFFLNNSQFVPYWEGPVRARTVVVDPEYRLVRVR